MPLKKKIHKRIRKIKSKGVYDAKTKSAKKPCLVKIEPIHNKKQSFTNLKKGDVNQPCSPYHKLARNILLRKKNNSKREFKTYKTAIGLSSKDKTYIISRLQNKTSRYSKLKELAARAKRENKIFSIYGSSNAVRKALVQRGWVEKIPPNRMNLAKINSGKISSKIDIQCELERLMLSNLVETCVPNFVWRDTQHDYDTTIDMKKECKTIVNKLKTDALWTTKQGLCNYMKLNYWFYIDDVAEVICPRTYNSYDTGELEDFLTDYRVTACTSLIQWVISVLADGINIFAENGTIPIKVLIFALNRCKEYLFLKRNIDIDQPVKPASTRQWNVFLKNYYRLITNKEVFESDKENRIPLYLKYAQFLLKRIHTYRPQIRCEGYQNIWIIKPGHWSRGRGIRMASKLGVITDLLSKANSKYVVQKYIEKPLLIYETKFDIRQYYLVTSTYPLVIWMYKDCYLKFSSQKYNLDNYHESIHLTNNAVQRKYKNYIGRHSDLPMNNMWELNMYKKYLKKMGEDGVWEHIIYPGMKKSIIGIMLSGQDSLPMCKNRFELYGCDFLLDEEYLPWLIEINSCPDLTNTTEVTAKICPEVVDDIIKVVIDYTVDHKASTGKFECIYRQPMTVPRFSTSAELFIRGTSLPNDYFYKGNVALNLCEDFVDSNDEMDKETALNKLRSIYNEDAMDDSNNDKCSSVNSALKQPNFDITVTEKYNTMNSNLLRELMGPLHELESKIKHGTKRRHFKSPEEKYRSNHFHNVSSIHSLFNNIFQQFSNENMNDRKKYSYKKIDDEEIMNFVEKYMKIISNTSNNKAKDYLLQATSQIISFINTKEKEYYANLHFASIRS